MYFFKPAQFRNGEKEVLKQVILAYRVSMESFVIRFTRSIYTENVLCCSSYTYYTSWINLDRAYSREKTKEKYTNSNVPSD